MSRLLFFCLCVCLCVFSLTTAVPPHITKNKCFLASAVSSGFPTVCEVWVFVFSRNEDTQVDLMKRSEVDVSCHAVFFFYLPLLLLLLVMSSCVVRLLWSPFVERELLVFFKLFQFTKPPPPPKKNSIKNVNTSEVERKVSCQTNSSPPPKHSHLHRCGT